MWTALRSSSFTVLYLEVKVIEIMKVYISGKIGEEVISEATRQRFARAEEMLKAKGFDVVNPASEQYQKKMMNWIGTEEDYHLSMEMPFNRIAEIMQYDFEELSQCDALYLMKGWAVSGGASLEYDFARYIGVPCLFEEADTAINYLECRCMSEAAKNGIFLDRYNVADKHQIDVYVNSHLHDVWLPIV